MLTFIRRVVHRSRAMQLLVNAAMGLHVPVSPLNRAVLRDGG